MRRALIVLIVFFLAVTVYAGVYLVKNSEGQRDTNVSEDADDIYPEDLRPVSETDNETDKEEIEEDLEEILPDEDFTDFEIEEEPVAEEPEEAQTEEEPTEEELVEEEEPAEEPTGNEIEIILSVNVREAPDSGSNILGVFKTGERGVLIEEGNSWSVLRIGDLEGYVYKDFWKKI